MSNIKAPKQKPTFHTPHSGWDTGKHKHQWAVIWIDYIPALEAKWFDNEEEARNFYTLKLLEWEANR